MDLHVLKTDIVKFNFLNFYISEITLYFLLKLAQFASNKW